MNLKYQFDSSTWYIDAGVSSALVVWIDLIIVVLLFDLQRFLLKQLEYSLSISMANR